jgi:thiol-disulfide isomerase/thioredoxin
MFMKRLALAGVLLASLTAAALAQDGGTMMKSDPSAGSMMKSSDAMKPADDTMMKSGEAMKGSGDTMMKSDAMMASDVNPKDPSAYNLQGLGTQVIPFSTEKAAQTLAKTQTVVYFFAATWCPDCRATYKDIRANFAQIPKSLTVVFVNYDKASQLKNKYGITQQHTFVVVGPRGEKKKLFAGATTVTGLVESATTM